MSGNAPRSLWYRNALTATLVVGVVALVGAPVLIFAYPELRRVDAIPQWWELLAALAVMGGAFAVLAWMQRSRR